MPTKLTVTAGWDVREAPDETPLSYVAHGAWPEAVLARDAPPSAHIAQAVARRLRDAMDAEGVSVRALARRVGVTHPTIGRVLNGAGLPDVRTLFLLEVALQRPIWPAAAHAEYRLHVESPDTTAAPGAYPPGQEPAPPRRPMTTTATRAILRGMAAGQTHASIADELGISTRTVGARLAPLYAALNIPPGDTFRLALWWATSPENTRD
jgi:transcriptional regulator with XRE-family HTH domain